MSLSIFLYTEVDLGGETPERIELDEFGLTHNLGQMALAADLYDCLWRPEESGIKCAGDLLKPLRAGIAKLEANPGRFKLMNPSNGWGSYDGLLQQARKLEAAAVKWPKALVYAER